MSMAEGWAPTSAGSKTNPAGPRRLVWGGRALDADSLRVRVRFSTVQGGRTDDRRLPRGLGSRTGRSAGSVSSTIETKELLVPSCAAGGVGDRGCEGRCVDPADEQRRRGRRGNVFVGAGSPKRTKRSGPRQGACLSTDVERSPPKAGMARSMRGWLTKIGADASMVAVECVAVSLNASSNTASTSGEDMAIHGVIASDR